MSPLRAGSLVAAAACGLPLWSLVRGGALDPTGALLRAALVTAACVAGADAVGRLIDRYRRDAAIAAYRERLAATVPADRPAGPATGSGSRPPG